MLRKILFFFFITSLSFINAQESGIWQNYTNMQNVRKIVSSGNSFWAATEGGVYYFTSGDSTFIQITKSQGLSSHDIKAIAVDKNGKVWIGASDGIVNIYDPQTQLMKKILDIANSDYTQKGINDIVVSGDTAFIATDFGMSLININDLSFMDTIVKFGELPAESIVSSIWVGEKLIIATKSGIAVLKENALNLSAPESWNYFINADLLGVDEIYKSVFFNNTYYAGTDNGLFAYNNSAWELAAHSASVIKDLEVSADSLILFLNNSVHSYKTGNDNTIFTKYGIAFNSGTYFENKIYVATTNGSIIYENGNSKNIYPNGPNANTFNSIAIGNNGEVWAASGKDPFGKGFYLFENNQWTNFNRANNSLIINDFYHTVSAEKDGNIYFSNWGDGFTVVDKNKSLHIFNASNTGMVGISNNPNFVVTRGIHLDSKNNLWVLNMRTISGKNLAVLSPDSSWHYLAFTNPSIGTEEDAYYLAVDQYDTKWFTVEGKGLYYFNENGTLDNLSDDVQGRLTTAYGLNSNDINSITVDKRGEVWIGTNLGVNYIPDPSRPKSGISSVFSLRQQTITCITVDPLNRKWVGTTAGVSLISPDGTTLIAHYDTQNSSLPTNTVHNIAIDENSGMVYFGTDYGLVSLQTTAIKPSESFTDLFVYPNPFVIANGKTNFATINGLVANSSIKIFSINGTLVREFVTLGGRIGNWDGRDDNGNLVASGIYIITAFDAEADNVGSAKIAVIRE